MARIGSGCLDTEFHLPVSAEREEFRECKVPDQNAGPKYLQDGGRMPGIAKTQVVVRARIAGTPNGSILTSDRTIPSRRSMPAVRHA